ISELIKIAAPKVIRESLNITHGFIHKLLEDINLRKRSYQATLGILEVEKEVMKQLEQLEEDAQKVKCDISIYSSRVEQVLISSIEGEY
ncbi:hypothetical protein RHJ57_04665, partial [Thermosynechococcus sp. JY1332]